MCRQRVYVALILSVTFPCRYTTDYSEGLGEYFEYTLVLVFIQCIFNVLFALFRESLR